MRVTNAATGRVTLLSPFRTASSTTSWIGIIFVAPKPFREAAAFCLKLRPGAGKRAENVRNVSSKSKPSMHPQRYRVGL